MILAQDFEDFIALLNKHKVQYLVVGGYALALHGKPRHTGDLDIWINITDKNATRVLKCIKAFGFGMLGFTKDDFMEPGYVNQIGYPPLRIDILTSIDGVGFDEAYANKIMVVENEVTIPFISLQELIKNKKATGRPQDLLDVKQLQQIKPKKKK